MGWVCMYVWMDVFDMTLNLKLSKFSSFLFFWSSRIRWERS